MGPMLTIFSLRVSVANSSLLTVKTKPFHASTAHSLGALVYGRLSGLLEAPTWRLRCNASWRGLVMSPPLSSHS